jgi:hypothetical protein
MRGIVYRPGKRRVGSIFLVMGIALAFAGGSASVAVAKRAGRPVHPAAKHPPVAHATGHKIA